MIYGIPSDESILITCGTRGGKSNLALDFIQQDSRPSIIFNTKRVAMGVGRVCDGSNTLGEVLEYMKRYKIVDFFCDYENRHTEVERLIMAIFEHFGECNIVIDEGLSIVKQANPNKQVLRTAETGLGVGKRLIVLTQSQAGIHSDLERNCWSKIYLHGVENMEWSHLEGKKYPVNEIRQKLEQAGKYHFVVMRGNGISKPMKAKKIL